MRAAGRHGPPDRQQRTGSPGIRPHGASDRFGRHNGADHEGRRAADASARSRQDLARDLRHARDCRQHGRRAHRAADHPGCTRNARRTNDPNDRGCDACRISADAAAVLLIEMEGLKEAVEEQVEKVTEVCRLSGAKETESRRPRKNAIFSGKAARTRSARSAESARPIMSRTEWCHVQRSPRLSQNWRDQPEIRLVDQQHLPRGRRQHAPHHSFRRTQAGRIEAGSALWATRFWLTASRSEDQSPGSTASAWKRWR